MATPNPEDIDDVENEETSQRSTSYSVRNVKRRERRAKSRISILQRSMNYYKRVSKAQQEKIEVLSAALQDTQCLVHEKNKQIKALEERVRSSELEVDVLQDQNVELREQTTKELDEHEAVIVQLTNELQESEETALQLSHTFSSRVYSQNVRKLYYTLLSMRLPPVQIKTVIKSVISHLFPTIQAEKNTLTRKIMCFVHAL